MAASSQLPLTYSFGSFVLDPSSGELRRNGTRLKLQDQPFQVLLKLLEKAGSLVTREELQSTLWVADTFVDFDTGLNSAIKRLREALGDSADVPRYIETIPRRGYRFHCADQRDAASRSCRNSRSALGSRRGSVCRLATLASPVTANYSFYATYLGRLDKGRPSHRWKVALLWRTPRRPILLFSTPPQWGNARRAGLLESRLSSRGHLARWLPTPLRPPQDVRAPRHPPHHGFGIGFGSRHPGHRVPLRSLGARQQPYF